MSVDVASNHETKKKLKDSTELEEYILIYSGLAYARHAVTGVALIIKKVPVVKNRIHSYQLVNE